MEKITEGKDMKSEQELKEIYINSHHKVTEQFFDELFELTGDAINEKDITSNAEKLQGMMKKEIENLDLTVEEKEYIKAHIKSWATDKELNHDLMRHIFKKLIDNKEKISNKKV